MQPAQAERRPSRAAVGVRQVYRSLPLWALVIGAFAIYGLIALLAYRPILPGQSGQIPTCACGDPALLTWVLRWVPYAISHGRNPFFSDWTNYPAGVNLAQNIEMPVLGLLMAPVTVLVGPIVGYNLLNWLAFPASATAMFFVTRRWTGSTLAAFLAGLLYGFSAFVVGEAVGHVMLSFVPLPPLFFYQLHKIVIRRTGHPYRDGLVLGAIAVLQFFIEPEVLASLGLLGICAIILIGLTNWRSITKQRLAYCGRALVCGVLLTAAFVAYPFWVFKFGPHHFNGSVNPSPNKYSSSLLGPLITTYSQHFSPHFLYKYGRKLGYVENGSYLGLPLILLSLFFVVRFRRNRWLLFCAGMSLVSFVLSLGPRLKVVTHATSIPLPFSLFRKIPVLNNMLPDRLTMYVAFFMALVVALGVAECAALLGGHAPSWSALRRRAHARAGWGGRVTVATAALLCVLAGLTLVPKWPYPAKASNIPGFFTTSAVKQIPIGSVTLTYPFPDYPDNQAMLWQAVGAMRFKEIGTYALIPDAAGRPTLRTPTLPPAPVQRYLATAENIGGGRAVIPPLPDDRLIADVRLYLRMYHVRTVIVDRSDPTVTGVPAAMKLFVDALGPPRSVGGVDAWFDVPSLLAMTTR